MSALITTTEAPLPAFATTLANHGIALQRGALHTLQVNLGKLCNQACHHCHVDAGPKRTEIMERATVERLLDLLDSAPDVQLLDLTGGAPELNPHFRHFVRGIRARGREVIDRCNLTVLSEPGQEDTAEFLAEQGVHVVASLPCYTADNVDQQRGKGVFGRSVAGLKALNALGYGQPGSGLVLDLVYNPVGPHLPPAQAQLEADYHERLHDDLGVVFNHLLTITNMPISRWAHGLKRDGQLGSYMHLLHDSFNPAVARDVMCTGLVSVGWDGQLYDCDFNQMLEMPVGGQALDVWGIETLADIPAQIALGEHCYGCTAGAGSSCGGALGGG